METKLSQECATIGFGMGFRRAIDMISDLAPQMDIARDSFVMENLVKFMEENAQREEMLFHNVMKVVVNDDGSIVVVKR